MGRIDIFKVDNKFDERERGRESIGQKPSFFRSSAFFHLCSPRPDDDLFTKSFFFMVFTKSRIGLENSISRLKKSKYFVYLVKTLSKTLCLREL